MAGADDAIAFQARFLRLLERQTATYTIGDSTSVPLHVAADLLRSVCFVLGIDPDQPEVPERLLSVDLEQEFRSKLTEIQRKLELSGSLWRAATAAMPPIPNTALHDTLVSIGNFPQQYDYHSMAHEIPCVFDYPLCQPVSESLLGVDYINEYLQRLLVEFDFLSRFETDECIRALHRTCPDFVGLLLNLYEPVATSAIGRAAIGRDPRELLLTPSERAEVVGLLLPLGHAEREAVLHEAARAVCKAVGVRDARPKEYLIAVVPELLPRIEAALCEDLRGVFV